MSLMAVYPMKSGIHPPADAAGSGIASRKRAERESTAVCTLLRTLLRSTQFVWCVVVVAESTEMPQPRLQEAPFLVISEVWGESS